MELSFDPFDLEKVQVRWRGQDFGTALVHTIRRRSHPKAKPEPEQTERPVTGIDYLRLVAETYESQLKKRINYTELSKHDDQERDSQ